MISRFKRFVRSKKVFGAARLQQVFLNLLSNAIKFRPQGGNVEVRLERASRQALIQVGDTRNGIGADFLPYVFDTFVKRMVR
jgi:signal transduction histidine kinase